METIKLFQWVETMKLFRLDRNGRAVSVKTETVDVSGWDMETRARLQIKNYNIKTKTVNKKVYTLLKAPLLTRRGGSPI